MTVREMLECLTELPLDREMYIEFDGGHYIQHFSLDSVNVPFDSDCGIIFKSQQLNDTIQEDFTPKEEW